VTKPALADRLASGVDTVVRIFAPGYAEQRQASRLRATAMASFVGGGGSGPLQTDLLTGEVTGCQETVDERGPTPNGKEAPGTGDPLGGRSLAGESRHTVPLPHTMKPGESPHAVLLPHSVKPGGDLRRGLGEHRGGVPGLCRALRHFCRALTDLGGPGWGIGRIAEYVAGCLTNRRGVRDCQAAASPNGTAMQEVESWVTD